MRTPRRCLDRNYRNCRILQCWCDQSGIGPLCTGRPATMVDLMPAIFETYFHCMFVLHPGKVIGELPAVDCLEAKLSPSILPDGVIFRVVISREINFRGTGILAHEASDTLRLIGSGSSRPKDVRPASTGRQRITTHEPAVPRDRGVIGHVIADDPLELGVGVVGHDP